jgi:hypothetical protein
LASVDQGLHGVITWQVPVHKLHALLANLKRLVREILTLPVGPLSFHLAFWGWKVDWVLTLHLSLLFLSRSYLGIFEKFAKKDKVPRMVPSIAQASLNFLLLWLVCGALGRIIMRLICATWYCCDKDRIQEETSHTTWSRCASLWNIFYVGGDHALRFSSCVYLGWGSCFLFLFFFYALWSEHIFFFLWFLRIYFFPSDPSLFLQDYKEGNLFDFGVFIFGGWMACFA